MLICVVNLQCIKNSISQKKKIMEIFFFLASFHLIIHESNNHLLSVYYAFSFFHLIFSYGRETEIGI